MINRILPVLLMAFVVCSYASADTLTLKSGKVVEGKIVERDDRAIQLNVGLDFPITYYLDEIKDIAEDKPAPSLAAVQAVSPKKLPLNNPQKNKADELEQQGLTLIDQDQMDAGLKLLREAVELDPQGSRHLNLGSILFGNGVSLQRQDKISEASGIFRDAEAQLQQAVKMFDPDGETTFISEAYNLLGEIHANAFNDAVKARMYYEKSVSYYDNPSARRALKNLP